MKYYLVSINDLIVNDGSVQYNFLCEMYPVIDELYNRLWFYNNLASMNSEVKEKKIIELKTYISQLLESYNIPENILFTKIDNNYIEPLSRTNFKLNNKVFTQFVSDEFYDTYIENNRKNAFFRNKIPEFKELTKTKYKKR